MASTVGARRACWVSPMSKARSQRRSHWSSARRAPAARRAAISSAMARKRAPLGAAHGGGVVPGDALDGLRRARRTAKRAVLGDGAARAARCAASTSAQPAGRPVTGDHPQPGRGGARERVVGRGHQRAVVGERVVDVAEDAAQPRARASQLASTTSATAKLSEVVRDAGEEVEAGRRRRRHLDRSASGRRRRRGSSSAG